VDSDGLSTTNKFSVTVLPVNDRPTLGRLSDLIIPVNAAAQTINLAGIGSGAPNEIQLLTVSATSDRPLILPDTSVYYISPNGGGTLTLRPLPNASGSALITVTVKDDGGLANGGVDAVTRQFRVTVSGGNHPPTLSTITAQATLEDTPSAPILVGVADLDEDAEGLFAEVESSDLKLLPLSGVFLELTGTNYSLVLTPAPDRFGTAKVSFVVRDSAGASATNQFDFTVLPVNDRPTLGSVSNIIIDEDAPLQTILLTGIGTGASNEVQFLTVTAVSDKPFLLPNPAVIFTSPNSTGSLAFQPVANSNGVATITVTVKDDGGSANGGKDTFQRQFTVLVRPVNDPPTATLNSPGPGVYSSPTNLTLRSVATDIDGTVVKVEYFDGAAKLGEASGPPYQVEWPKPPLGSHSLTARAMDNEGRFGLSAPVSVFVQRLTNDLPTGDILIVRNFADPEIDRMKGYINDSSITVLDDTGFKRPPVVIVADQEGLTFSQVAKFRLVIWDDLGQTPGGIGESEVELFANVHRFGIPCYLIGEVLALKGVPINPSARAQWTEFSGLQPADSTIPPGGVLLLETNRVNELFQSSRAESSEVLPFDYPRSLTPGAFVGTTEGEARATMGGVPVLLRFPGAGLAETSARRLTQNFLITDGTAQSQEERRKLFLNGVAWLLGNYCDAVAPSLECGRLAGNGPLATCSPFTLRAEISNGGGRCSVNGTVLTQDLPANWEVLSASICSTDPDFLRGSIERTAAGLKYFVGVMPEGSIIITEVTVMARRPGIFTNAFLLRANGITSQSCSTVVEVTGTPCGDLSVVPGKRPPTLRIPAGIPAPTIILRSPDLLNWTSHLTNPPSLTLPISIPVELGKSAQFYRLIYPPNFQVECP
jgi:hypothetical protein